MHNGSFPSELFDKAIRAKLLRIFELGEKIGAYKEANNLACFDDIRENNKQVFQEQVTAIEEIVNLFHDFEKP